MNKKILFGFLLSAVVLSVAVAPMALAVAEKVPTSCVVKNHAEVVLDFPECTAETCYFETDGTNTATDAPCGLCCLIGSVYFIADWIFAILMLLVMIFILWGAFEILTSAGNEEKFGSGRQRIMFAAIGFAVALLAKAVPGIIQWLL